MSTKQMSQKGETTIWEIDPSHTTVGLAVKHLMITTVKGRMGVKAGTVRLDESEASNSMVEVTIDASSIDTQEPKRDEHLRSADFLSVEEYPLITFRSTLVERKGDTGYAVTGDLTIRDVTKPVLLDVQEVGRVRDPWGGDRIAFEATAKFDRRDWDLTWNQVLEAGGVTVGHELRISLDVQAVKQEAVTEVAA